jgi:hypothetical protein
MFAAFSLEAKNKKFYNIDTRENMKMKIIIGVVVVVIIIIIIIVATT